MADVTIPTEPVAAISTLRLVKVGQRSAARRLIAEMYDGDPAWQMVPARPYPCDQDSNQIYYLRRTFKKTNDEAYYCPQRCKDLGNSIFSIAFSNAPSLKLSFVEGIIAYLSFKRLLRAHKRLEKQLELEHITRLTQTFLERNGV